MAKKCEVPVLEIPPSGGRPLATDDVVIVTGANGLSWLYTYQEILDSILTLPAPIDVEVLAADDPSISAFKDGVDTLVIAAYIGFEVDYFRSGLKQSRQLNQSGYYFAWDKVTGTMETFPALAKEEMIQIVPVRK